jgi:pimeloyl-ACP methyl ester carboxylesterase
MGNLFGYVSSNLGIDSFGSIHDTASNLIFQPPTNTKKLIKSLNNCERCNIFNIESKNKHKICVGEFWPKNPNSNVNKIVIFSHGNASDIYTFSEYLQWFSDTFNVVTICYDYIGYGITVNKDGHRDQPSEKGCRESIETVVYYYLANASYKYYCQNKVLIKKSQIANYEPKIKPNNIILIGQSLGTGVVIDYASIYNWTSPIILISPYKSIPRVILDSSISDCSFAHNTFKSNQKISKLHGPVKCIHGAADELISAKHSSDLYNQLVNKMFSPLFIENAGHNDILDMIPNNHIEEVLMF